MTVVLEKVSKVVAETAHIRDVSITLQPGSINVLLGPTLAGKTSLMRLLAGLDAPTAGRVLVDGKDVTGVAVRNRSVAMVYQQFINYPAMTVFENIASPLRVRGAPKAEIEARVRDAAKLMRLEPYLGRTPLSLSGGQQQRTAIARALVKGADLVLLDEPLANLDYKLREELRAELPKIFGGSKAIFVYATTEPSEALLLGGNTATLHQGAITQYGPTVDVYRSPQDRQTAEVFSDPPMNFLPVTVDGSGIRTAGGQAIAAFGTLMGLSGGGYQLGFRPSNVYLSATDGSAVAMRGSVAVSEITGSESFIHIDTPAGRWIALTPGVRDAQPGQPIEFYLDPARFFVFASDGSLVRAPHRATAK